MSALAPTPHISGSQRPFSAPAGASTSRRPGRLVLLVLLLLGLAPPAYLLQTGGALTTGYEIQKLERERAAWINRNQQLEVEIARAHSLAWVEHEAVYRLGMQRPSQSTVVRVDDPIPPPTDSRLLRRGNEPVPAAPADEGPSWTTALGSLTSSLGRGQ
jgi:hypothetical protein